MNDNIIDKLQWVERETDFILSLSMHYVLLLLDHALIFPTIPLGFCPVYGLKIYICVFCDARIWLWYGIYYIYEKNGQQCSVLVCQNVVPNILDNMEML